MKIKTAVTINGHLVELIGNVSKSIRLFELEEEYGKDLFLVDSTGNIIGNIRIPGEDVGDIIIKEINQ